MEVHSANELQVTLPPVSQMVVRKFMLRVRKFSDDAKNLEDGAKLSRHGAKIFEHGAKPSKHGAQITSVILSGRSDALVKSLFNEKRLYCSIYPTKKQFPPQLGTLKSNSFYEKSL